MHSVWDVQGIQAIAMVPLAVLSIITIILPRASAWLYALMATMLTKSLPTVVFSVRLDVVCAMVLATVHAPVAKWLPMGLHSIRLGLWINALVIAQQETTKYIRVSNV